MPIMNWRRAIVFPLIAALLAVGGMACIFGGGGDADAAAERLDAIDERSKRNSAELGLLEQEVERLTKTNEDLTEWVVQLQQDKDAQAALIEGLQAQVVAGAAGGAAAGADQAAMDDAAALDRFIECTVNSANPGANAFALTAASTAARAALSSQLQSGSMTYDAIRAMIPNVCNGQ